MKIAFINSVCGYSSTGKNTIYFYHLFKEMGFNTKVFYGVKHDESITDNKDFIYFGNKLLFKIDHVVSALTGFSDSLANIQTNNLLSQLETFNPDIVCLYNIHGGYLNEFRLLEYCKNRVKWTIYVMADEYPFLGKCCYSKGCEKYKFEKGCYDCEQQRCSPRSLLFDNSQRIFRRKEKIYQDFNNIIFASAPYIVNKARNSWLLNNKSFYELDTFVDIKNMYYPRNPKSVRNEFGITENHKVVILCAAYTSIEKGAQYYHEAAKKCLAEKDIVFIHVGFDGDKTKCPSNMVTLPYVSDQDRLSELLSLADAYICTSIADAQPNACINALGCGTPIIGFNISGVPFVANSEWGTFVKPFDVDALVTEIKALKKKTENSIQKCHYYAMQRYSIEANKNKLNEFLSLVLKQI